MNGNAGATHVLACDLDEDCGCPDPYYSDANVTIYLGDCLDVLPKLGPVADAIVTDPPYVETALGWDKSVCGWPGYALRALHSGRGHLWCFGSLRSLAASWSEFEAWSYAQDVVWEKHNGSACASDRFRRVHELAAHFYAGAWSELYKAIPRTADSEMRGKSVITRSAGPTHAGAFDVSSYVNDGTRIQRSVMKVRSCHGSALHPTQKPDGILRPLITSSCPPGGVVLDPFFGSGSIGAVARQEGRRAIGIEKSEAFCEVAARRLSQGILHLGATV